MKNFLGGCRCWLRRSWWRCCGSVDGACSAFRSGVRLAGCRWIRRPWGWGEIGSGLGLGRLRCRREMGWLAVESSPEGVGGAAGEVAWCGRAGRWVKRAGHFEAPFVPQGKQWERARPLQVLWVRALLEMGLVVWALA